MKPKAEMLRNLTSSLLGSQWGTKVKEKDMLLIAFIVKTRFWIRKEKGFRGEPKVEHLCVSTLSGAVLPGYVCITVQQLV